MMLIFDLLGEKARIVAAGGFVDYGRVNGNLALSRALGDFEFKRKADLSPEDQIVTAYPDVSEHSFTQDDEFVVLACDGSFSLAYFTHLFDDDSLKVYGIVSLLRASSNLCEEALPHTNHLIRSARI